MFGLGLPGLPLRARGGRPAWTSLAFRGESRPMFALRGEHCLFALVAGWRKAVALLLLQRLMRLRRDAIFFHAASVAVDGGGRDARGAQGRGQVHPGPGPGHARPRLAGRRARLLRPGDRASWSPSVARWASSRGPAPRLDAGGARPRRPRPGARRHDARARGGRCSRRPRPAPCRCARSSSCGGFADAPRLTRVGAGPRRGGGAAAAWAARSRTPPPPSASSRSCACCRAVARLPPAAGDPRRDGRAARVGACAHEPERRRAGPAHRHLPLRRGAAHGDRRGLDARPRPRWR